MFLYVVVRKHTSGDFFLFQAPGSGTPFLKTLSMAFWRGKTIIFLRTFKENCTFAMLLSELSLGWVAVASCSRFSVTGYKLGPPSPACSSSPETSFPETPEVARTWLIHDTVVALLSALNLRK